MATHLALFTACVLWAVSFIATKVALKAAGPYTVVFLRLVLSSLCFAPWLYARRAALLRGGWSRAGRLFVLSLFGTSLHYTVQTMGLQYTTASNASLYAVTGPISILLIAAVFLGERITLRKAGGISVAVAGVLVVMGLGELRSFDAAGHLWGDLLVFASIFLWAAFTVYGKKLSAEMGAVELLGAATLMGTLCMVPVALWEMDRTAFRLSAVGAGEWAALAFLGVGCSFLATLLYCWALERTESQKVGVYLYTIPPMTYAAAGLFLGETIGLNLLAGSAMVIAGVVLTERG